MVAKAGGDAVVGASRGRRNLSKPSWLLCNIADLDERIKNLRRKKDSPENSFSARANSYYDERPHLLELLNDLYNNYLSLADRYCHSISRDQHHSSRCSSPVPIFDEPDQGDTGEVVDSLDPKGSQPTVKKVDIDVVFADLVMKTVEYDVIMNELNVVEKKWGESSRKMELQKTLLDLLESERLILLNDNATLGYRVSGLVEENKGLANELLFLKRKASELSRCILKTREDHRVCLLSRKIEDLQGQIYGLEKRNNEQYVKQEEKKKKNVFSEGGEQVNLEDCFRGSGKCFSFKVKKGSGGVEGVTKLWDKVKKFNLILCGKSC